MGEVTDGTGQVLTEESKAVAEAPQGAEANGGLPKGAETVAPKVEESQALAEIARLRKEIGDKDRGNGRLSAEVKALTAQLQELTDRQEAYFAQKRREEGLVNEQETVLTGMAAVDREVAKRAEARKAKETPQDNTPQWTTEQWAAFNQLIGASEAHDVDFNKPPDELISVRENLDALWRANDLPGAVKAWKDGVKHWAKARDEKVRADAESKAVSVRSARGGSNGVGEDTSKWTAIQWGEHFYSKKKEA